jgi:hypothetical protein
MSLKNPSDTIGNRNVGYILAYSYSDNLPGVQQYQMQDVKTKFTLEQVTKAQRGSRGTAPLFP